MSQPKKTILESRTTMNVAGGTGASALLVGLIISLAKRLGIEIGEAEALLILSVGTTVLGPLVSRLLARWRG